MKNVLILCTGNSARSILGECLFTHLPACRGKFRGYSAGSFPTGKVNPFAIELLKQEGIPTEGLRSKSWDEFSRPDSPKMDFVFTVCDSAAGEQCPLWLGSPLKAHWGIPDPAAVQGSDDDKRRAFREAYAVLRRRIERFAGLSLDTLDTKALQRHLDEIGQL